MFYNGMPASTFAAHLVWVALSVYLFVGTPMSLATAGIIMDDTRDKRSAREAFVWSMGVYLCITVLLSAIGWLILHDVDGVLSV